MKLESQITNNHSSLIDNQSKRRSTFVENSLQITPFMQNKPNFENDKMNITIDTIGIYNILSRWRGQKTKPIQSQFKPNITQNKPNLSQNKPKTKPNKPNWSEAQVLSKVEGSSNPISMHPRYPELSAEKKLDIWDDLVDKLISDLGKNLSDFI